MIELNFENDPVSDRATAEERTSWGALKIWANGYNLCTHYELGELHEAVNWNWWALLNWLAENWNPLFHEQALPVWNAAEWAAKGMWDINRPETFEHFGEWDTEAEASADGWFRRHCLWSCRDGGLLPNVVIRRFFDDAEVSWTSHTPPGAPDHFKFQLTSGGLRLPVAEVAEPLHQFLAYAVAYVADMSNTAAAAALVKRVDLLEAAGQTIPRLGWLAGFGKRGRSYVHRFRQRLEAEVGALSKQAAGWFFLEAEPGLFISGHCQGTLAFGAVAPALNDDDRLTLASAMVQHRIPATEGGALLNLVARLDPPDTEDRPHTQGYDLARDWRELCGLNEDVVLDMQEHLEWLGVNVQEAQLSDPNTSGVALLLADRAPLILLNRTCVKHTDSEGHVYPSGRRFTLAHELCHLLVDRSVGADLALVSGPWAPKAIERRANAFAAALLMPDAIILRAYAAHGAHPSDGSVEALLAAAKTLDVSPDALSYHLHNCGFIRFAEREALRAQLVRAKARLTEQN